MYGARQEAALAEASEEENFVIGGRFFFTTSLVCYIGMFLHEIVGPIVKHCKRMSNKVYLVKIQSSLYRFTRTASGEVVCTRESQLVQTVFNASR